MKKQRALFALIFLIAICLSSCAKEPYPEDEIIGLTSVEVTEKYGNFDRVQGTVGKDGLYRSCACGYLISEKQTGFFGSAYPEYFMIFFDENGIADHCRREQVV